MPNKNLLTESIYSETGLTILKRKIPKSYPLHWHEYFEIEYILSGSGYIVLNGNNIPFKAKTIWFTTLSDTIEIILEPGTTVELYNISFRPTWIDDSIYNILSDGIVVQNFPNILIERLIQEYEKIDEHREKMLRNLLNCIIIDIIRETKDNSFSVYTKNQNYSQFIQKSLKYIHQNFKEPISQNEVAEYVGLSTNYFSAKFHNEIGESFKCYVNNLRLTYSSKLLINTDISIVDVAFASGFTDISNYYHTFKKKYGISPLQYRKHHQANIGNESFHK